MPEAEPLDAQLRNLRSSISDLGHEIDSYKTATAAALGLGVFLLLLAAGAGYDLAVGTTASSWLSVGITRITLIWIAAVLGSLSALLLLVALLRVTRRDKSLDFKLDQMEQEYAELLDQKEERSRA